MAKMTFSPDDETVRTRRLLAGRKQKPQSLIVLRSQPPTRDVSPAAVSGSES
jgi:hypothetical protein